MAATSLAMIERQRLRAEGKRARGTWLIAAALFAAIWLSAPAGAAGDPHTPWAPDPANDIPTESHKASPPVKLIGVATSKPTSTSDALRKNK